VAGAAATCWENQNDELSKKRSELWPEQTKNQNDEQSKPAVEKSGLDNAEASNTQQSPEPKQSNDGETPEPATESKELKQGINELDRRTEAQIAARPPKNFDTQRAFLIIDIG
jgi:hypothetical protein